MVLNRITLRAGLIRVEQNGAVALVQASVVLNRDVLVLTETAAYTLKERGVSDIPPGYAYCGECGTARPRSYFNADNTRPSGIQRWCRECSKRYKAQHIFARKRKQLQTRKPDDLTNP